MGLEMFFQVQIQQINLKKSLEQTPVESERLIKFKRQEF